MVFHSFRMVHWINFDVFVEHNFCDSDAICAAYVRHLNVWAFVHIFSFIHAHNTRVVYMALVTARRHRHHHLSPNLSRTIRNSVPLYSAMPPKNYYMRTRCASIYGQCLEKLNKPRQKKNKYRKICAWLL